MIIEIKVPSPGESISEVQLASWLVSDGAFVEKMPKSLKLIPTKPH
jgi:2-oxoglutarate dehydrogenase E2 component (dihydrolipoamide succinyltransferase)